MKIMEVSQNSSFNKASFGCKYCKAGENLLSCAGLSARHASDYFEKNLNVFEGATHQEKASTFLELILKAKEDQNVEAKGSKVLFSVMEKVNEIKSKISAPSK